MNTNTVLIMLYTSEAKETGVNWLGFMSLKSDIHRLHEIPVHSLHELQFSHLWAGKYGVHPCSRVTNTERMLNKLSIHGFSLA